MMKIDTLEEFTVPADHGRVRRKRTRRHRSAADESHNSFLYSSPATSSGISTSTEEDEDMANCLILLARGDSPPLEDKLSGGISSTEMATTRAGRVGLYVYECKTCNRTFQSFHALGGHMASHKRPKPTAAGDHKKPPPPDQQGGGVKLLGKLNSNKICQTNDQIRPKIHECLICGSEFASGQALGGHMRRHRAAQPPPAIAMDYGNLTDVATEKPRSMVALDLDLNLPAPPEDDKFNQFPADQQPRMVFSTAALVDCHY